MTERPERPARLSAKQQAVLALKLQEQRQAGPPMNEPIAVIGLGCRFPGGADSPAAFWQLLQNGVDAVDEVPPERWPLDEYFDPDPAAPGKMYSRWGAFLPEVDRFDARFFGLAPREVANMDPQQRLLLEVAWEALENAGIVPGDLERTPTGVFVGVSTADYARLGSGDPGRIDAYYGTGNSFSVAAGRIAFLLGAQGPVFALDTACSSSLVALHQAVHSLRARECSLALVGGVNLMLIPETTVFFAKLQALSPDGRCKAFDASANGYVRGEGAGAVVLKRLSAALRDGDPIAAVIRGTAINHDGPSSGLTVPNGPAQQAVIRQALRDGNVDPSQIGYIEAHGTGTSLGDPIEMHALAGVFGQGERDGEQPLYVGSVKSNLGHLEAAAGIAGLLKVVLALQHRQVPPHLHFREPSPRIEWATLGPIRVPTALTEWPALAGPRLAGVSAFGFSGTNAHVVVEEAPAATPGKAGATGGEAPAVLLPLSAKSEASLRQLAGRYAHDLAHHPERSLADVAYTASRRRPHYDQRLAVTGASAAELAEKLAAVAAGESPEGISVGVKAAAAGSEKVVFVFPGQGPEWLGMGRQLYAHSAVYREAIEACDAIVAEVAGWPLRDFFTQPEAARPLLGVDVIHPVLFAAQVGLARLWQSWGLRPAAVVGQSLGEITALHVAGSLSLRDALTLMIARSQLIHQLHGNGRMVMVGLGAAAARQAIAEAGEVLYVAVERGADSVVVAGRPETVDRFVTRLQAAGVFCRVVVDDVATHCPVADPIVAELGQRAASLQASASDLAFYSTVTASPYAPELVNAAYWQRNITEPVRWHAAVQALLDDGYRCFLEVSPHPTLVATLEQAAQAAGHTVLAVGSTMRQKDEWRELLASVGRLYVAGLAPDWARLYPAGVVVPLPTYAWDRERHWIEAAAGANSRARQADLSGPAALRGQRVPSPLAAVQFSTTFDEEALPYLPDHKVEDTMVVAGAAHVAQLLEVAGAVLGDQPASVRNISFLEPLFVTEGERQAVQVVLEPQSAGRFGAQVFGRPAQAGEAERWALHVTAQVEAGTLNPTTTAIDPAAAEPLPREAYHAALDVQPYRLTGSFRRLEALWREGGSGALLARLRAPATTDEHAPYRLHPGLLDSCFQAIGAAAFFDTARPPLAPGEIYVPVAIEAVHWQRPGLSARYCQAVLRPAAGEVTAGDVHIFDEAGQLVASVVGFQARRVTAAGFTGASSQRLVRWRYGLQWQRQALTVPSLPTRGQWLILADAQGVAGAVAAELRRRGGFPILVAPEAVGASDANGHGTAHAEAYRRLVGDALAAHKDVRGVIHCWGMDGAPAGAGEALGTDVRRGTLTALALAQALRELPKPPRLWLVTRQAALTAEQAEGVWQSALWGLGRVIANELPELRCALVDVDGPDAAKALVDELLAGSAENQVALHAGRRLVARLGLASMATSADSVAIRAEATYVITGGFGGLGLAVAGWLAAQGARHLLLIGRREPPPEAQAALDQLRADGADVVTALADVAERDQLAAALGALEALPPLAGVVHAAGTLEDALLAGMDAARFERVLRAKVDGAWHLHTLTLARPLDFFVLFSSVAAVFGSPGQANHAAASAFLDGLAHYRRSLGLPGQSVNWGPWAGVGAATGRASAERVMAGGMAPIEADWGLTLLGHALAAAPPQVIAMAVDWGRWFRAFPGSASAPVLADLAQQHAAAAADGPAAASVASQLSGLARPAERREFLQAFLTRQIAHVLRLPPAQIGPDTPFGSLGFDSLMTLEVKNSLEKQLGLVLPVSLVWNYPTVTELAGYLAGELGLSLDDAAEAASAEADAPGPNDALDDLSEGELLDLLGDKLERLKKGL